MSVFNRLKGLLHGVPDPAEAARAVVHRLEQDVTAMSASLLGLEADASSLHTRIAEDHAGRSRWERDAESCVRRGDDATARECLRRAAGFQVDAEALEKRQEMLSADLQSRRDRLADLQRELRDAQLEMENLAHRDQFADGEVAARTDAQELTTPGIGRLDDLRSGVESKEMMADAVRESLQPERAAQDVTHAQADAAVEDRLAALKRQLNPPADHTAG